MKQWIQWPLGTLSRTARLRCLRGAHLRQHQRGRSSALQRNPELWRGTGAPEGNPELWREPRAPRGWSRGAHSAGPGPVSPRSEGPRHRRRAARKRGPPSERPGSAGRRRRNSRPGSGPVRPSARPAPHPLTPQPGRPRQGGLVPGLRRRFRRARANERERPSGGESGDSTGKSGDSAGESGDSAGESGGGERGTVPGWAGTARARPRRWAPGTAPGRAPGRPGPGSGAHQGWWRRPGVLAGRGAEPGAGPRGRRAARRC